MWTLTIVATNEMCQAMNILNIFSIYIYKFYEQLLNIVQKQIIF